MVVAVRPAEPASVRLQFDGRSGLIGLEGMRLAALRHLDPHKLPPRCVYAVEIVLEEWLTNVLRHGGLEADALQVQIQLQVLPTTVEIRFEDNATPFDPLARPVSERAASLDEALPGGLGLDLIKVLTVNLVYERLDNRNTLVATVARAAAQA